MVRTRTEVRRWPAAVYLQPAPLLATAILVINDQILKERWSNSITGKLSDLAGVFLLPLLALGVREVFLATLNRPWQSTARMLAGLVILTGVGFTAVKSNPAIAHAYGYGLGCVRWPFQALGSLLSGGEVRKVSPAVVLTDWTDLVVLPTLWISWRCGLAHTTTRT